MQVCTACLRPQELVDQFQSSDLMDSFSPNWKTPINEVFQTIFCFHLHLLVVVVDLYQKFILCVCVCKIPVFYKWLTISNTWRYLNIWNGKSMVNDVSVESESRGHSSQTNTPLLIGSEVDPMTGIILINVSF